jgi:Ca2+-binding EF-hand superfamily protein
MKSILDPSFRYTPSSETDVRKTFKRIRREQQAQIQEEQLMQIPSVSRRYTPRSETDVRKTFKRIRRKQQAQIQEEQVTQIPSVSRTAPLSKEPFDLQLLERPVQRGELKSTEAI